MEAVSTWRGGREVTTVRRAKVMVLGARAPPRRVRATKRSRAWLGLVKLGRAVTGKGSDREALRALWGHCDLRDMVAGPHWGGQHAALLLGGLKVSLWQGRGRGGRWL